MHEDEPPRGDSSRPPEPAGGSSVLSILPGLARITVYSALRTTRWTVEGSVRVSERLMRAAVSSQSAAELFQETGSELREHARRALGLTGLDPIGMTRDAEAHEVQSTLRDRGAELLRRSADVTYDEELHPAYEHILNELTPDEGRILRLMAREGARASVDVRGGMPLASELVAQGLSMIGAEAGCRHPDRVHPYLNNLNRLGLIWFSREAIKDLAAYQVIEAQPEAAEARRQAGRFGRTVRRSVRLTPFGEDFCTLCLPLDLPEFGTGEFEALKADADAAGD